MRQIVLMAMLLPAGNALAHALLEHADPPVGSTVAAGPAVLTLEFSEGIETLFSHVTVTDAGGARVDRGDLHTAPDDRARAVIGLLPLRAGTYRVAWHVVSVDTHKTEGSFTFTVGR